MAAFPLFRNRRLPNRSHYTLLEHTDPDADSVRRRSISSQRSNQSSASLLCDKCWLKHERSRASKRCLDCQQNLCTVCARCDETTRPWWLPGWLVQCWRFIFTKAYTPHSVVELQADNNERPHWAHTQEACNVQRIPRVSRFSLRSNQSSTSGCTNKSIPSRPDLQSSAFLQDKRQKLFNPPRYEIRNKEVGHSQSLNAKAGKRQKSDNRPRRTRSTDELVYKHRRDDLDRLKIYKQNWEDFENSSNDSTTRQRKQSNKMKGKDVDIEITGDKEIKLTVYCSDDDGEEVANKRPLKCSVPKRKCKRKSADKPYTEEIFEKVPIWFRKTTNRQNSKEPKNRSSHNKTREACHQSKEKVSKDDKNWSREAEKNTEHVFSGKQQNYIWTSHTSQNAYKQSRSLNVSNDHRNTANNSVPKPYTNVNSSKISPENENTPYIVEEPPDACPICLDDLPVGETRVLSCSHVIHTKCLITYLHKMELDFGIRCPVCAQTTLIHNYYVPKEIWYMELPVSTQV